MKNKIAIIGEGGGMRNAITAGFIVGSGITPKAFDAYYGTSSAIGNGLYFAAGQADHAFEMWVYELTTREVMDYKNAFKGRYMANIDHMVDNVCSSLDANALQKSEMRIVASVVQKKTGAIDYLHLNNENFRDVFKATCSIPYITRPILIGDNEYVDGGIGDNFPILKAYEDGYRNFLVLNNQPKIVGYTTELAKAVVDKMSEKGLRNAMKVLIKNYYNAWEFTISPPADVNIYQFIPTHAQSLSKFERDPEKVKSVYLQGVGLGKLAEKEVAEFIEKSKMSQN